MLKLRRATVIEASPPAGAATGEQRLTVELRGAGERREAIADLALVGPCQRGDDVIVNVEALDLGLGSGGFDVVHVNLSRGPATRPGARTRNVMKLNYTSLQHTVEPVETVGAQALDLPLGRPVAVLSLHGQLAPVAWAYARANPGGRLGYVQTEGGALPGGHSRTVAELRRGGLLDGHITAGAAHGGELEAVSTAGALHHGIAALGWDAAVVGPGPGIVGSSSRLGHGGMAALDSRARRARARLPDAARRAHVLGRRARPPPRHLPPHPDRAGAAARAGDGRAAGGDALARRRGPARRPRRGLRRRGGRAPGARARRRAPGADHAPRLAPRRGRPAGLRGERAAGRDDGAEPRRGPAVLRRGAGRRRGARRAGAGRIRDRAGAPCRPGRRAGDGGSEAA